MVTTRLSRLWAWATNMAKKTLKYLVLDEGEDTWFSNKYQAQRMLRLLPLTAIGKRVQITVRGNASTMKETTEFFGKSSPVPATRGGARA